VALDAVIPERPLHSERWHQVASLRPRWRLHARSDPQRVRGATWHVASGDARTNAIRLDGSAWSIAGRCDGRRTVQAIWDEALAEDPEGAPTQDETIELLARLVEERCLACEGLSDVDVLRGDDRLRTRRRIAGRLNPIAPRMPLGDPHRLLRPFEPLAAPLFSRAGALAWLALVLVAGAIALVEWDAVARHAQRWLQTPRYLLLASLAWLPMKLVHEVAHALALVRHGGRVGEVGVSWILGLPVPYVDASASDRFAHASQRALVAAAGILAESALAAIGLIAWAATEPGWLNDAAFAVAVVGVTSTLLFNGNPLLRMDGYFVLCDLAGLPNLATRSGAWWQAALRRALGWREARGPDAARAERPWLVGYAPLAFAWRAAILAALLPWAGAHHRLAGAAVAAFGIAWLLVLPLHRLLAGPARAGAPVSVRWRVRLRAGAIAGLAALGAFVVPVPDRVVAPALVSPHEDARVRAGVDGFVVTTAGDVDVEAGAELVRLDDPWLRQERERLLREQPGLRAELFAHLRAEPARARRAEESLARNEAELARVDERLAQLRLLAPVPGRFSIARAQDLPGRFVREGDEIGTLLDARPAQVRLALDQDAAARLREGVRSVDVRLAEAPGRVYRATLRRQSPAAVAKLPGAALGERFGGPVQVDPADGDGLKPARPTYVVDVGLEALAGDPAPRPGGRAWVRLDFGDAPLAAQAGRWLHQTVRARFAPDAL
jgi:putative peptide zinc metalloprotease protein